ncbi:MAG: sodium:proton antiporter [Bacteroidetes bacterium 46-16]|nr:MAG: sodium:proton antiporter [Bacteroidetes bacterium 46-16]
MQSYYILTVIITICAGFAYLNHRIIKLPPTIGIMVLSLITSLAVVAAGKVMPSISQPLTEMISTIDFHDLLMKIMLSFLLFAGAIHIDAAKLKAERLPVIVLATVGTLISTFLVGGLIYFLFGFFDAHIDFIYCLLFGALISPTDPIAVLGILKRTKIPGSLQLKIAGESLFNDGVAVVIFLTIMEVSVKGTDNLTFSGVSLLFLREAVGGLIYGALLGYAGFFLLRSIDNYKTEVLITIAMVMGGYMLADELHISGPIAMVVAGLITGNKGKELAMSDTTRDYIGKFWELIDEILNAILFLLVGFEMLVVKVNIGIMIIGVITIFVVLLARWISVALPITLLRPFARFEKHAISILAWGGLRGGISVALALSLPAEMYRDQFVSITYSVVIFSIIVQGLTIERVAKKLVNTD